MKIDAGSEKPIFVQIAEQIEDSVFTGVFQEEEKIPSTNEIAVLLNINPHTVLKGMNRLVEEGIIIKGEDWGCLCRQEQWRRSGQREGMHFSNSMWRP